MRRQSKTNATKTRSRKPAAIKRHRTPASRHHSAHRPDQSFDQLRRELDEAREQQTAAAGVLRVISSSPGDLEPVFQAILSNATRICEAKFGTLYLRDADAFRVAAMHNTPPAYAKARQREPLVRPPPDSTLSRVSASKQVVHINDVREVQSYIERNPFMVAGVELGGYRTALGVPMLKQSALIGVVIIYRQEVRPFNDKQIELVKNFAAQAVIAIENARLLNELRQRTTDLAEALEQQTAASEVLSIISSSPAELEPVFQAILANATKLCGAKFAGLSLYDGEALRYVAHYNVPPEYAEMRRRELYRPPPRSGVAKMVRTKQPVQISDLRTSPAYLEGDSTLRAIVDVGGARTMLLIPMLKDDKLIGGVGIYRQEVLPFTDRQVALVQNFAAQAVIAIENARLLSELRQSLEQQTAAANVLRVISSSPGDLKPVFDAILENATRICQAGFGTLYLAEGNVYRTTATHNVPPAYAEWRQREPVIGITGNAALARVVRTKSAVQIADVTIDPAYREDPQRQQFITLTGARTLICVPMLKDDTLIGVIAVYRLEVRLFTDKQIELLKNFAAQAVIAIENVRLLNDLNKLNQQLGQRVADQVSEIERMSRLRRFLPPQVADLIVASGTEKQLESHRREITALFCDLRGYTGFSESSDPEDVMALLRDYHAAIGKIIFEYGGTLERFAGDGVMVIFNDPVPVPNPALQAVRMALDMRVTIRALIERWRRLGHDLGFGIGIAHGFATLGTIGFEGRFDYAAIGSVSNVASRLCDEAKPGQILISPRVLLAVEDAVTVEAVGDFELKGIRRPVAAYNVLAAKHSN